MSKRLARMVYGAIAGSVAAACMTVIRMAARRRGIIEKTIPQALEERVAHWSGLGRGAHPVLHHLADQMMHVGYGATLGVGYALVTQRRTGGRSPHGVARGVAYGVATWFAGSWLLLPALRAKQAAWRKRASENAVDLLAHLVFGAATAIVSEELSTQSNRGPTSDSARRATRVG